MWKSVEAKCTARREKELSVQMPPATAEAHRDIEEDFPDIEEGEQAG